MIIFPLLFMITTSPLWGSDSIEEDPHRYATREKDGAPKRSWARPQDPRISIQSRNLEIKREGEEKLLEKAPRQKHAQDRFDTYTWCAQFGRREIRDASLKKISGFKGAKYDEDKLDQFENDEQRRAKRKIQNGSPQEKQEAGEILLERARQEDVPLMDTLSYIFNHGTASQTRQARSIKRARTK